MLHPVGGAMGVTLLCRGIHPLFGIISLNIHKTTLRWQLHGCCTSTSTAVLLLAWQGTQLTVLQLLLRYSVEIYKCANASELKTQQESVWVA